MTASTLERVVSARSGAEGRAQALGRMKLGDEIFRVLTYAAAIIVLLLLAGVAVLLFFGAWPAFRQFGLSFLTTDVWNADREKFGAAAAISGTLVTAVIAMIIGVPVGIGIAVFLTELCPLNLRRPIGVAIELLAGIPSIIYGIWGAYFFKDLMAYYIEPGLVHTLGAVPVLGLLFASSNPLGADTLTAGIVLSMMILPFVTAISRDVFETVPTVLKEAAYGLGMTTFEVVFNIVLPYTRVGVIGGVMLALGRALGETMAVTFVIGSSTHLKLSLLEPGTTISAMIALQFPEASPGLFTSSLLALGFILFIITFLVLIAARLLLARLESKG
jgi:phosphate transport system permease protein